jgi:hypothetical protein
MLTCLNPLAIHIYSLACLLWYSSLAECDMCSRLFIYCIYTTWIAAQTWRLLLSTRRACHQSAACGVPFWRSAASCSLWWCVVETLGHVMVLILSFTLWHCIWYSLSHYVCVTWSWRTCILYIRVCLQIRVWQVVAVRIHVRGSFCFGVLGAETGHLVVPQASRKLPRVRGEALVYARHGGGVREAELAVAQQWWTGAGRGVLQLCLWLRTVERQTRRCRPGMSCSRGGNNWRGQLPWSGDSGCGTPARVACMAQGRQPDFLGAAHWPTGLRKLYDACAVHHRAYEAPVRRGTTRSTRGVLDVHARRGGAGAWCLFSFGLALFKLWNSKFLNGTWKSPNTKVVEKL